MAVHACETYDFPVKRGPINYVYRAAGAPANPRANPGGAAIRLAKQAAEQTANQLMANETCRAPCARAIYVESTITFPLNIQRPRPGSLIITVTGTWEAGILCYRLPEKAAPHAPNSGSAEKKAVEKKPKTRKPGRARG